ncbi:unnamed protein product [Arctia plantaginis]|uniref:Major facilitator superfamily (MFS) profile domain-containing protein n=1 Tax=Arctia plantaginis TaxID=874455 RepID=A0A8S0Z8W2_ARCPL|nr:unnamed protein product [Arctia plantaginis]
MSSEKLPFEAAMNKAGFGLYGVMTTALAGLTMIAYSSTVYGGTFIVPTSACELGTTPHQQGILAAGPMAGLLLGSMVWSYLADKRGRRTMILIALMLSSVSNIIGTISVNWIMLMICQFISALLASGLYSMSMTYLSESVPKSNRSSAVLIVSSVMLITQGLLALLAIPIIPLRFSYYLPGLGIYWNSWRLLMLMFSVPQVITAICYYFMQESPKFVFTKGDEAKALAILQTIYRINNRNKNEELQVKCLLKDEVTVIDKSTSARKVSLFKMPLLKYTIIMLALNIAQQLPSFVVWLPKIADHFVRILQTGDRTDLTMCQVLNMESTHIDPNATPCALNTTSLLFVLGVGVMQAIFNLCMSFMINFVGRRNMVMAIYLLCGGSGILVNLVPNIIGSAILFILMLMGIVIVGLCTTICVDLFPTHLRAQAIAVTMTAQYIAIVASIQVLNLLFLNHCDTGFYLFSTLFALAAIVTAFLPNDRQPQSVQSELVDSDAENFVERPRRRSSIYM